MEHDDLETIPLYEEDLALAAPVGHPLAEKPFVRLDVLKETPCVLLPGTYVLRRLINEHCRLLAFAPQPVMEMTTMDSIVNMVGKGVGVTVLPKTYLDYIDNGHICAIPIQQPALTTRIGVAYRKNKYMCAASRVFMEQLLAAVNKETATRHPADVGPDDRPRQTRRNG